MVSPLYIKVMIVAKSIHNDMSSRSAVVYVAYYMQQVYDKPLDCISHGNDEIISSSCLDDGLYDDIYVLMLIWFSRRFVKKLLNDIRELFWKRFSDLRTCIF